MAYQVDSLLPLKDVLHEYIKVWVGRGIISSLIHSYNTMGPRALRIQPEVKWLTFVYALDIHTSQRQSLVGSVDYSQSGCPSSRASYSWSG